MKRNFKRCCGGTKNKESMVLQIVRKKTDQVVCYSSVEVEETAVNSRLILSKRIRLIWCSEKISKL